MNGAERIAVAYRKYRALRSADDRLIFGELAWAAACYAAPGALYLWHKQGLVLG